MAGNKRRKTVSKQFVLIVYKNGVPVKKIKSIRAEYVISNLKNEK